MKTFILAALTLAFANFANAANPKYAQLNCNLGAQGTLTAGLTGTMKLSQPELDFQPIKNVLGIEKVISPVQVGPVRQQVQTGNFQAFFPAYSYVYEIAEKNNPSKIIKLILPANTFDFQGQMGFGAQVVDPEKAVNGLLKVTDLICQLH